MVHSAAEPTVQESDEELRREREARVLQLERRGLLGSERLRRAMLIVRREDFIPPGYRDHAYEEIPLPLPGERATISCPHSYPLFYEPLGLGEGHRFLEVGVGSGYGTSLAREVVGPRWSGRGDRHRRHHARVRPKEPGTGGLHRRRPRSRRRWPGASGARPYDAICITAACPAVPPPLIEQLTARGRLIAPIIEGPRQRLTLLEKTADRVRRTILADVLYVSLRGRYGVSSDPYA
jgi:protein-L-isoaspartate(D-aspartate) O-methyltransferase